MATNSEIEWTDATWNPVTGLHEGEPRMQELLCRADGEPAAAHGPSELRQRISTYDAAAHA